MHPRLEKPAKNPSQYLIDKCKKLIYLHYLKWGSSAANFIELIFYGSINTLTLIQDRKQAWPTFVKIIKFNCTSHLSYKVIRYTFYLSHWMGRHSTIVFIAHIYFNHILLLRYDGMRVWFFFPTFQLRAFQLPKVLRIVITPYFFNSLITPSMDL